jgi:glyoxylase-like metal-dependent hydrolase (beta-lactamase superfamily II)
VAPEVVDLAPGLWIWRLQHPDWSPDADWEPPVTSTCVQSGGEVVLIDPLAPPDDAKEIWERLGANPPTVVVILKPDHVRDVDLFVERYDARAYGPSLFWRNDIPRVWATPWHEKRTLPALRELLDLPFERVIVSHGDPVHDRAAYERALELPAWDG